MRTRVSGLQNWYSLGAAVCLAALCCVIKGPVEKKLASFSRPSPTVTLETAQFYSRSLKRFSLGFDNLLADLTWVQLLQGASHEEMKESGVSWEYAKIRAILDLDRKFPRAYSFGSAFVSIFRRDEIGAKDILEHWTRYEPTNWQSHYTLGFHLYHEMNDYAAAAPHIFLASTLERAPTWLVSLGVRLLSEQGGAWAGMQSAISFYPSVTEPEGKRRLLERVRALNYTLQKAARKEQLIAYRKRTGKEPASIEALGAPQTLSIRDLASGDSVAEELLPLLHEQFQFRYNPQTKSIEGILSPNETYLDSVGIHK